MSIPAAGVPRGSYEHVHVRGRCVVLARDVPVLEDDAHVMPVPAQPCLGELGAVAFTRDLGLWLSRLFDRPIDAMVYRENLWDHRPYPRAQTHDVQIAGHLIRVTAYDVLTADHRDTCTAYAIGINTRPPVPFTPRRPARHLAWQFASAAWRVVAKS